MPAIQEFIVEEPDMMHEHFTYRHPAGENHQEWIGGLLQGDKVELWFDGDLIGGPYQGWLSVEVGSSYIDDGSGNAPGANAHFYWVYRHEGKRYKIEFQDQDKIRVSAPTIADLEQTVKLCEGLHCIEMETRYNSAKYGQCYQPVTMKVRGSWYCEAHGPYYARELSGEGSQQ